MRGVLTIHFVQVSNTNVFDSSDPPVLQFWQARLSTTVLASVSKALLIFKSCRGFDLTAALQCKILAVIESHRSAIAMSFSET